MIENFGGSILYLILFLIQLLGLSFYCYLILLNPKSIINDYQVGDGAIAVIRLIGSFILPIRGQVAPLIIVNPLGSTNVCVTQ